MSVDGDGDVSGAAADAIPAASALPLRGVDAGSGVDGVGEMSGAAADAVPAASALPLTGAAATATAAAVVAATVVVMEAAGVLVVGGGSATFFFTPAEAWTMALQPRNSNGNDSFCELKKDQCRLVKISVPQQKLVHSLPWIDVVGDDAVKLGDGFFDEFVFLEFADLLGAS